MPIVIKFLRKWDLKASKRPDYYIADSINVQKRIKKYYGRDSFPIFPPVDVSQMRSINKPGQYYLVVSRIEPYKKVDLVIEAFKKLNLPLKIVGAGTRLNEYRNLESSKIEFVGRIPDDKLAQYYQNSIATIFPQEEDAGIVPLESMAAGKPVIAYGRGGALESIVEGKTGIFFAEQSVKGIIEAVEKFQKMKFDSKLIRTHAEKFDKEIFKERILGYLLKKL